MPRNPGRRGQGGDVEGTEKIDTFGGVPVPSTIDVSAASYDPGYLEEDPLSATLRAGYVTMADVKRGYCSYGESIGDGKHKWNKVR